MTIQSTSTLDTSSNTISLIVTQSSNTIESISYNNSSQSLTFSIINAFSLSAQDFIAFAACLDAYKTAIIRTFKPTVILNNNFTVGQVTDFNDGLITLSFNFAKTNHPLYSITANYPSGSINFSKRNQPTTLVHDEWLYYHDVSLHYEDEIHKYYKI